MFKPADLVVREDFSLGPLQVSPAVRSIEGPAGKIHVEPLIMNVFLRLVDANGQVVTRNDLFDECWGGVRLGDESLNRAITMVRRIALETCPGAFRIESIPRTGYRLLVDDLPDRLDALARSSWWKPAFVNAVSGRLGRIGWQSGLSIAILGLVAIAAVLGWKWFNRPTLPVVVVTAAEPSLRSQALSRDLVVKLGMLASVGFGKWKLADSQAPASSADLIFRVAGTGSASRPQGSIVLLDGNENSVLWSREFGQTDVSEADLRLQLALTAGQVLGCALEARDAGGVRPDLLKMFLVGCAAQAESSEMEPHQAARIMRAIVDRQPGFRPAWSRLLLSDLQAAGLHGQSESKRADVEAVLAEDIGKARESVPDLPLLKVIQGEMTPLSPSDYAGWLKRMERATSMAPDIAQLWLDEASWLARVGHMSEAVELARRAVELDPLSPATRTQLISHLAWSGRIESAKEELAKAERQWPGTGALRDAQWAFHSRYGDLKFALTLGRVPPYHAYFKALLEPTPANVNLMVADIQRSLSQADFSTFDYAIQALGEFDRTEETFAWLSRAPPSTVAESSFVLFRPGLADVRRDPRFMIVAKRIGLLSYWQKSREWPDFCFERDLPYDCKQEAAKLG